MKEFLKFILASTLFTIGMLCNKLLGTYKNVYIDSILFIFFVSFISYPVIKYWKEYFDNLFNKD